MHIREVYFKGHGDHHLDSHVPTPHVTYLETTRKC